MSNIEHAIATQRLTLGLRRQGMRRQLRQLRSDARSYCAKPSTLIGAFLAGTALGTLHSPRVYDEQKQKPSSSTSGDSFLREQAIAALKLLAANAIVGLLTRPPRLAEDERV